jgi:hypothetical protein
MSLRGGIAGTTKLSIKAKGVNLTPAALPAIGSTVTAQLVYDEEARYRAQCWEATCSTAEASRNDARGFKGKGE